MSLRIISLVAGFAGLFAMKSPAWLSIEFPVNPFDPATRGAALLVHAQLRDNPLKLGELNGAAEGIVNGARRTIPLRFEETARPGVFSVHRQWPAEGRWMLRISAGQTTAVVSLDAAGNVTSAMVPTMPAQGMALPRAFTEREIDSVLARSACR